MMNNFIALFMLNCGTFYLLYKLLLKSSKYFTANRIYLLLAPLVSVLLTQITISTPTQNMAVVYLQEAKIGADNFVSNHVSFINWLLVVYLIGIAIFSLRFLGGIYQIQKIKRISHFENGVHFTQNNSGVFSFMNNVFAYSGIPQQELKIMLAHEQIHINQKHSIDLLIYEIWCIACWFNPFVWLLKKELQQVHEFEADALAVSSSDKQTYCELLVKETFQYPNLSHSFNQSSTLKTRIMMLTKNKSVSAWRYLAILPLCLLLACSQETKTAIADEAVIENPEVMPEFSGGTEAMMKFLSENIQYPKEARENKIEARVVLRFTVNKDGAVSDVETLTANIMGEEPAVENLKDISKQMEEEAVRVVKSMPDWTPAQDKGKIVSTKLVLPIQFRLQ